jgi:hypothetical protein
MLNPKDVQIAALQAEVAALKKVTARTVSKRKR